MVTKKEKKKGRMINLLCRQQELLEKIRDDEIEKELEELLNITDKVKSQIFSF